MKRKYGLVGYPLGHSFSRSFFQQKFEDEHINATYENFEIQDISCLRQLISDNHELCGLNVTIPHKTTVIPLLDELHPLAREIGAVNVIKITRQGDKIFLKGFNSDIIGFTNSIAPLLDDHMTKALILGTGGASKAIHAGLKALHITPTFVSRQKRGDILSYEDLSPDLIDNHKIIVNTTPLGMFPHIDQSPNIPYTALSPEHLCYDVIYNPETTLFLQKAARQGCTAFHRYGLMCPC